jgi:hypothetical protein
MAFCLPRFGVLKGSLLRTFAARKMARRKERPCGRDLSGAQEGPETGPEQNDLDLSEFERFLTSNFAVRGPSPICGMARLGQKSCQRLAASHLLEISN